MFEPKLWQDRVNSNESCSHILVVCAARRCTWAPHTRPPRWWSKLNRSRRRHFLLLLPMSNTTFPSPTEALKRNWWIGSLCVSVREVLLKGWEGEEEWRCRTLGSAESSWLENEKFPRGFPRASTKYALVTSGGLTKNQLFSISICDATTDWEWFNHQD